MLKSDNLSTVHATVFWKPVENLTFGAEVIYGEHEFTAGGSDDNVRLQSSVQWNF